MFDSWSIQKKVGVAALGASVVGLLVYMSRTGGMSGMGIPGGRGQHRSPWDFEPDQFMRGMQVEMEHTDDWCIAGQIVMDHLDENPDYYGKGMPGCKRGEKLVCK